MDITAEARSAVAALLAEYALALDEVDVDRVVALLKPAAVTFKGIGPLRGEEIRAFYSDALERSEDGFGGVLHQPGMPVVQITADPSRVVFTAPYMKHITFAAERPAPAIQSGRYSGSIVATSEGWRFETFIVAD
jgi:hypothetical protein